MPNRTVRLFLPDALAAGEQILTAGPATHYLARVMRLGRGDAVRVFNGRDGEWLAQLAGVERTRCVLDIKQRLREPHPEPGPWLVFAPIKKNALDVTIAGATELGVERFTPVRTRFTVVERINGERLRAQATEAAEQCGRLTVPIVDDIVTLDRLIATWPPTRRLLFLDERGDGADVLTATADSDDTLAPGILVGPEGGFAEAEAAELRRLPFATPASLGPRTLRAETAAIAALACWQAFAGDWRRSGGFRPFPR